MIGVKLNNIWNNSFALFTLSLFICLFVNINEIHEWFLFLKAVEINHVWSQFCIFLEKSSMRVNFQVCFRTTLASSNLCNMCSFYLNDNKNSQKMVVINFAEDASLWTIKGFFVKLWDEWMTFPQICRNGPTQALL